jgi:uncharacterized protein
MKTPYNPLLIAFVYHFNATEDYFECHEVLEELWMEEGRDIFYQGLLQIAVGLYHHRNGNVSGAIKLLSGGIDKLGREPGRNEGMDIGKLLADSRSCLTRLQQEENMSFCPFKIRILDKKLEEALSILITNPPERQADQE